MTDYELADFSPDGHLHKTCDPTFDGYSCRGNAKDEPDFLDCAAILYAIAQDAEQATRTRRTRLLGDCEYAGCVDPPRPPGEAQNA